MRNWLADWAHSRAWANLKRYEDARTAASKQHFLNRSYFWGDVEAWLEGLGSWSDLSEVRERRRQPRARTPNTLGMVL